MYPEIYHRLILRGAEMLLHSSSEVYNPNGSKKGLAKQMRVTVNVACRFCYLCIYIYGNPGSASSTDGGSVIVHYAGQEMAKASTGESFMANFSLDIDSLRKSCNSQSVENNISRLRLDLNANSYKDIVHYPTNSFQKESR